MYSLVCMVNVSKRKLDEYILERLFDLLYEIFAIKRNTKDFNKIFVSLFSPTERLMIIKRLGAIYLLLKGILKRDICKLLSLSPTTLDKYQLILDKETEIYSYFQKIIRKEAIKNIFEEIINTLYGPGTPGVDWSEAWKTKRRIAERKEYGI